MGPFHQRARGGGAVNYDRFAVMAALLDTGIDVEDGLPRDLGEFASAFIDNLNARGLYLARSGELTEREGQWWCE